MLSSQKSSYCEACLQKSTDANIWWVSCTLWIRKSTHNVEINSHDECCRSGRALANPNRTTWWFSKVMLTQTRLLSSSAHPEPSQEGTPTDYCKDQRRCIFCECHEIQEQIIGASSLATGLSLKKVGSSIIRYFSWSTCAISVPLHRHCSPSWL